MVPKQSIFQVKAVSVNRENLHPTKQMPKYQWCSAFKNEYKLKQIGIKCHHYGTGSYGLAQPPTHFQQVKMTRSERGREYSNDSNVHGMAKLDTAFLQRLIQLGGLLPSFAQSISTFRCFCIEENAINLRI